MPYWMMELLLIEEGGFVTVTSATLPKATYVKLQPHNSAFIDISNPKAVLENRLRHFSCLTEGDEIVIEYNGKPFYLTICQVKPCEIAAVSIVETDVVLDFAPPKDQTNDSEIYSKMSATSIVNNIVGIASSNDNTNENMTTAKKEFSPKSIQRNEKRQKVADANDNTQKKFPGTGFTLSGKCQGPTVTTEANEDSDSDFDTSIGITVKQSPTKTFQAFSGLGQTLK